MSEYLMSFKKFGFRYRSPWLKHTTFCTDTFRVEPGD